MEPESPNKPTRNVLPKGPYKPKRKPLGLQAFEGFRFVGVHELAAATGHTEKTINTYIQDGKAPKPEPDVRDGHGRRLWDTKRQDVQDFAQRKLTPTNRLTINPKTDIKWDIHTQPGHNPLVKGTHIPSGYTAESTHTSDTGKNRKHVLKQLRKQLKEQTDAIYRETT